MLQGAPSAGPGLPAEQAAAASTWLGWAKLMIIALVLTIALVNFAIGFALAVVCGHGPALSIRDRPQVRRWLRRLLRLDQPAH